MIVGVAAGVADGVAVAPGLADWVGAGVLIGLALADGTRLGARVEVEEAVEVGVGALVQAASSTAMTKEIERSNEVKLSYSSVLRREGPHGGTAGSAGAQGTLDARCRSSP